MPMSIKVGGVEGERRFRVSASCLRLNSQTNIAFTTIRSSFTPSSLHTTFSFTASRPANSAGPFSTHRYPPASFALAPLLPDHTPPRPFLPRAQSQHTHSLPLGETDIYLRCLSA